MATVIVSDDSEGISSVDVEITVGGVNLSNVSSAGKAFNVNGREYPMTRFGSWAFQDSDGNEAAKKICADAGIIAALTWGLRQTCPQVKKIKMQVDVWVKDVNRLGLALQMTQGDKQLVLNRIASGQLAKDLERYLREAIPSLYENIRIKLIKIMGAASKKRNSNWTATHMDPEFLAKFNMLREMECISNLMDSGTHELAYGRLKQLIEMNVTDGDRIHMLIRLGMCCFELDKTKEMGDTAMRVTKLAATVDKDVASFAMLREDIADFAHALVRSRMSALAADMAVAFSPIFRKVEDPNHRIEKMLSHALLCCVVMKDALRSRPMVGAQIECRKYVDKVAKDVDYIRDLTGCNPLLQSRAVYYVSYMLNGIETQLGDHESSIPPRNSDAFSRIESGWADFPRILSLAEEYPEVAPMMSDPGLFKCVKEISENPALLEKRILDPRIGKLNAILNAEDNIPLMSNSGNRLGGFEPTNMFEAMLFEGLRSRAFDNKNEARKEKEKGNEAYKKKQYKKALDHYDKAIKLDPSDALLHSNKAAVYISEKRLDEAKSACLTAMHILQSQDDSDDKDMAKLLARLARVEFLSKRYDAAMALCQKSLRLHDDPKVKTQMKECEEAVLASSFSDFMRF